jgi:hypothetical protein
MAQRQGSAAVRIAAQQRAFLARYAELGNIRAAAEAAAVPRRNHYEWLKADAEYAERFKDAQEDAIDVLEAEARRRAVVGTEEPVFQQGREVGRVRKFSDVLLIFLLKGLKPDTYRERSSVSAEITRPPVAQLSDAELEAELLALADKLRPKEA